MSNNSQPEKIILIPPTHEVSTPSFHVEGSLVQAFQSFMKDKGFTAWQPPQPLEKRGPDDQEIVEIRVEADTPLPLLDTLRTEFLQNDHHVSGLA